jgi:hypothetical protein
VGVRNGAFSVCVVHRKFKKDTETSTTLFCLGSQLLRVEESFGAFGKIVPAIPVLNRAVTGQGRQNLSTVTSLATLSFEPCRALGLGAVSNDSNKHYPTAARNLAQHPPHGHKSTS